MFKIQVSTFCIKNLELLKQAFSGVVGEQKLPKRGNPVLIMALIFTLLLEGFPQDKIIAGCCVFIAGHMAISGLIFSIF